MDWRFRDALDAEHRRQASRKGIRTVGKRASTGRELVRHHLVSLLIAIGLVFSAPVSSAEACDRSRCRTEIAQAADLQKDKQQDEVLVRYLRFIHRGRLKKRSGDLSGAMESFRAALAIADDWIEEDPERSRSHRLRAIALDGVGTTLFAEGDLLGASAFFGQALQTRKDLSVDHATDSTLQRNLALNHQSIGRVRSAAGHLRQALESQRASLAIFKDLAEQNPGDTSALRDLAIAHGTLANAWHDLGEMEKALESASADLAIIEELLRASPDDRDRRIDLALSLYNIGDVHHRRGEYQKSYESFSRCSVITREVMAEESGRTSWQRLFGKCLHSLGDALAMLGRTRIALVNYRLGLVIAEGLSEEDPSDIGLLVDVMLGHTSVARLYDEGAIFRYEAQLHLKKALKIAQELEASGRLAPRQAWLPAEIRESLEALGR